MSLNFEVFRLIPQTLFNVDHRFRMRIDVKFFMTLGHLDEKYTIIQTRFVK
jgi:hypothetical protein